MASLEEGPVHGKSDSPAGKPDEGPVGESDSLVQVGKPEGMSKRQWKKLLKQETREKMKPEWKLVLGPCGGGLCTWGHTYADTWGTGRAGLRAVS